MIESAVFIVCLDDGSPITPTERTNQYLLGDIANRWSDKALQFVVCENGDAAFVCEHAMVDGGSLQQLNYYVSQAISAHHPSKSPDEFLPTAYDGIHLPFEKSLFTLSPTIEQHIQRVRSASYVSAAARESAHFRSSHLGSVFLRKHKCPPKTGFQLVIQLAAVFYFGFQTPSWETVSMRSFHKGRVDNFQAVLPQVTEFCAAARDDPASLTTRRQLFLDAAKALNTTITRVSRGRGFAGHLYALQEVLRDGEQMPALFTDPTHQRTRPARLMTDCTEWLSPLQEGGFMMPDPEHVWVHYEVENDG